VNFLTETLGTNLALADLTGTIQTQYGYEPFSFNPAAVLVEGAMFAFLAKLLLVARSRLKIV
jgi:hypothetical protein